MPVPPPRALLKYRTMSSIELRGVRKHYGGPAILDDLSMQLASGSFTAVVGRSGCGKSTLLKLCNGLEMPDRGEVWVAGAALAGADLPRLRRRIGYAVQGTGLLPHLSVRDNIALIARLEGWARSQIDQRIEELFALMQLPSALADRFPQALSGGQQQRVGLCRAMMLQPEVLLLDEPFAAIDPLTRRDIHQRLLALREHERCTTLLVTHDMQEALLLADDLVVLEQGRIVHHLPVSELQARHPHAEPTGLLLELIKSGAT